MGYDAIFQAIPDKEEVLDLARNDYHWTRMLTSPKHYRYQSPLRLRALQDLEHRQKLERFDEFYDRWYGVFNVSLNWGRRWDVIAYLLVEARRVYSQEEVIALYRNEDLAGLTDRDRILYRAIMGGDRVWNTSESRRASGANEIIRYMPSSEVHEAYQILHDTSLDELLRHYVESEMEKAFLYKFQSIGGKDALVEAFELLREFYYQVDVVNAGVLYKLV